MKKYMVVAMIFISMLGLCACSRLEVEGTGTSERTDISIKELGRMVYTGKRDLYYDRETKIVYYYILDHAYMKEYRAISPYYSENGKLVRFDEQNERFIELN